MKASMIALYAAVALAAGGAAAQDTKPKEATKPMTMQECKDYMAMTKTDAMKKDPARMKKDSMCADMMKKEGSKMDNGSAPK